MGNRPTEPGIWFYETEIDPDLGPDAIRIIDLDDVEHIEIMYSVTNWLGKAVPPNDCYSCRWENSCDDMEPCNICEPTGFTEWQPK